MEKSVNDESYKSSVSGSQSDGDSDNSSTDLKLIFNNEVWVELFFYNLKYLFNWLLACQCPAKKDSSQS